MKIKSCYLTRLIPNEDAVKEYTEDLGCTIRHHFKPTDDINVFTIEDATGNKSVLFVVSEELQKMVKQRVGVRVVVDDIKEAIEYFKSRGYEMFWQLTETESNFVCSMCKGDEIRVLFEHKHN